MSETLEEQLKLLLEKVDRILSLLETRPNVAPRRAAGTKMKKEKLEKFRKIVVNDSLDAAIKQFLYSDDPYERRLGVNAAAAFDQLSHVADLQRHRTPNSRQENPVSRRNRREKFRRSISARND